MNVLHVLHYSLPNLSGYTIRSKYIVESQKELGANPIVITSPSHQNSGGFIPRDVISGIPHYRTRPPENSIFSVSNKISFIREILVLKHFEKEILEIASSFEITVIHTHSPSINGLASLKLSRREKIPLIYEIRALWEDAAVASNKFKAGSLKYKVSRLAEQKLIKQADAIVSISANIKKDLVARGVPGDKIYIIPNGVDTTYFRPLSKDEDLMNRYQLKGKIIFGFIGSFFNFEGLRFLISGFHELSKKHKNVSLILVGEGEDFNQIKDLVKKCQLEKDVIITGKVPHEQILKYYSIMDVLVYPRLRMRLTETTTPLKPLEAMSMEKIVLCSDVGGLRELAEDGKTGLFFRSGDLDNFIRKSNEIISNFQKIKEIGKIARKEMVQNREWSKIGMKYIDLYNYIIK